MTAFIGIDPGKSGGLALLAADGRVIDVVKMPATECDLFETLEEWGLGGEDGRIWATLEFVRSSPQMGVTSAFTFGRGYGALRMALIAAAIPFEEVTPAKWQNAMKCRTKGDKNVSKRRAQELFPGQKVTHAIADALLIAEYGRRTAV